jgi:dicarboxylate transporter 10
MQLPTSSFLEAACAHIIHRNSYTSAKSRLLSPSGFGLSDGMPTHILASLAAGTVATTVCAPADVLKSRLQSAKAVDGKGLKVVPLVVEALKKEGPSFLMKGWTPAWLRLT